MNTYLDNWESIFHKRKPSFRNMASDGINRHQQTIIEGNGTIHIITNHSKKPKKNKSTKKELCPHCATINLKRIDQWTVKCSKCGYER